MAEISKHNNSSDCWMLISGKVYDITNFFGSHPGGNRVMAKTCGTNATDAYLTKDPNAKSASGGRNHSSNARSMLTDYYIGNLNQSIKQ
jgi:cytochrome b involved in lipid metabolism